MSDRLSRFILTNVDTQEKAIHLLEKLVDVANPASVYSEPVSAGDYTIITASEVSVGLGFGSGFGGGSAAKGASSNETDTEANDSQDFGGGGGGGGGGGSLARPVAVISVGPKGVQVEPVVDVSKIAITFISTFFAGIGSLMMMQRRRRMCRRCSRIKKAG